MSTQEVADKYYQLMKLDQRDEIQNTLYSDDVISIEPEHAAALGMQVVTKGKEAVMAKGKARAAIIETVHGSFCSEPVVGGSFFSAAMGRDITLKGKPRMQLEEIAVFQVKDGKIISEQFFY